MKPLPALVLAALALGASHAPPVSPAAAAQKFLAALAADQRAKAERPFELAARKVWQYTPGDRAGVRLRDLDLNQRALAEELLQASLSAQGGRKAQNVMAIEDVLGGTYASDLYWIEVFGVPSADKPWGWQFEGHHLVLTFTYADGKMSMTPAFFGAHPALVKGGKLDGLRVLGAEEDLALAFFATLSADQRAKAVRADSVPADIFTSPGRDEALREPEGLAGSDLDADQRKQLLGIVAAYAHDAPEAEAAARIAAVASTLDATRLAWFGPAERGRRFYYRIHGPKVLIEFDHTSASRSDDPHIHAVWRTPGADYGEDLLKEHRERYAH